MEFTITLNLNNRLREKGVEAVLQKAFKRELDSVEVQRKAKPGTSRSDRLSEAESEFESAKSTVTELKDELQNWLDGLPENLQSSSKASELEDAICNLESLESDLEGISGFGDVTFPGMY